MLANKPAVKILILLVFGIFLRYLLSGVSLDLEYIALSFLFLTFILVVAYKWSRKGVFIYLASIFVIFLGFSKYHFDSHYIDKYRVDKFVDRQDVIAVSGEIRDLPLKKSKYFQFVMEANRLFTNDSVFNVSGCVQVVLPIENVRDLKYYKSGFGITIFSGLSALKTARNPGDFDLKNYLNSNDIYARIYLDDDENILLDSLQKKSIINYIYNLRFVIANLIENKISGVEASFLKGIIIGDRSEIPFELKESFINSGVMHILAVSGLHVGIITLILITIFNVFRLNKVSIFFLTAICLIFYIFLTGSSPSVVRASIMAIVLMGALVLERKINVFNSIAVAALIILLIDSRQLFHPGFQLSFAAVISIVTLYPKLSRVKNLISKNLSQVRIFQILVDLFAVSFAAAIGTLPFTSYYFGKISIIGLVANLFIVPLMGFVLAMGVAFTIFSFISNFVAEIFAESTKLFASILLHSVNYFGTMKYSHINSVFSLSTGLFYYFWIFFIFSINKQNYLGKLFIGLLIILNAYVITTVLKKSDLEILFFDVGQGDAIFIRTPEEKYILIDAGLKNPYFDAAQRFVIPYFVRNNIKRIDLLINSHPHSDHLGGIPTILRNLKVNRMIDAGSIEESNIFYDYKKLLDSLKIDYDIKTRKDTILIDDKIRIYVLNPTIEIKNTKNLNNHSLVLKVVYSNISILLPGDIESRYEDELSNLYNTFLSSDILKCPHHGSSTSNSQNFIEFIKPKYAIISVGANNKYDHPSDEVIERLRKMNVQVYRTDYDGALFFKTDGKKLWNIDWR